VHSLKNSGGKLLHQFPETSFSGKEVWLWSQKLRCMMNSTTFLSSCMKLANLSEIFILFMGEINEQIFIERALIDHNYPINMTLLPLSYDLVRATIIS